MSRQPRASGRALAARIVAHADECRRVCTPGLPVALAFGDSEADLHVAEDSGDLVLYDASDGRLVARRTDAHRGGVLALAPWRGGVVSGGRGTDICVWDLAQGQHALQEGFSVFTTSVCTVATDTHRIAALSTGGELMVRTVGQPQSTTLARSTLAPTAVAFTPSHHQLLVGARGGPVLVDLRVARGGGAMNQLERMVVHKFVTPKTHPDPFYRAEVFSADWGVYRRVFYGHDPSETYVAVASGPGHCTLTHSTACIKLWSPCKTGLRTLLPCCRDDELRVPGVLAWHAVYVASCHPGQVAFWDVRRGEDGEVEPFATLQLSSYELTKIAVSRGGTRVAAATVSGDIHMIDAGARLDADDVMT
eukprot:m.262396 g.262396  ORF g.262396 m.262396 type:complete len:363 (+) comp25515_c0_seq1:3-1091(+)